MKLKLPAMRPETLKAASVILPAMLIGVIGVKLTLGSLASTPKGSVDVVTYEDSVTPGNELGGVSVTTSDGGSGVKCNPSQGKTSKLTGVKHGHLALTCKAAADGGPRTYTLSDFSLAGYVAASSPHAIGSTFHVSAGKTTTLSLVLNKVATPNGTKGDGVTDGALDVITYEGSVAPGNEIGGVAVKTSQGNSGALCNPTSGTTSASEGSGLGHLQLSCPGGTGTKSRAYVFENAARDGYVLSNSPHSAGSSFLIRGGKTSTLSLVMKKVLPPVTGSNAPQKAAITKAATSGSIAVAVYKHTKDNQPLNKSKDTRVGGVFIAASSLGAGSANQCPVSEGRTGDDSQNSASFGTINFANCPLTGSTTSGLSKKYQVTMTIPSGYKIDPSSIKSSGATVNGSNVVSNVTVYKNQTASASFVLVAPDSAAASAPAATARTVNVVTSAKQSPTASAASEVVATEASAKCAHRATVRSRIVCYANMNRGNSQQRMIYIMRKGGIPASDPWCAWFVSYVWKKSGVHMPSNGCSGSIGLWAKGHGQWHPVRGPGMVHYKPKSGDAVIYSRGSGTSGLTCPTSTHIGIVVNVYGNRFDVMNGNFGGGNDPNASRVVRVNGENFSATAGGGRVLGFASPVKD